MIEGRLYYRRESRPRSKKLFFTTETFSSVIESPQQNKRNQVSPPGGFVMRRDFIMIHKTFSSVIDSPQDNKRFQVTPPSGFVIRDY